MLKRLIFLLLILLMILPSAAADEAEDITAQCSISAADSRRDVSALLDRRYKTAYPLRKNGILEIAAEESISGIFIQFYDHPAVCDVQLADNGVWETYTQTSGDFLSGWIPLPDGTTNFRLRNTGGSKAEIAELTVYGVGSRPARAAIWQTPGKCDLMLLTAHPDDELLWFGGLLPAYAAERQLDVQLACLVSTTPQRRLELLDALWHCGVTTYPLFANMRDLCGGSTLSAQYTVWNREMLYARVVRLIRQCQPEVLITHDFKGEYRHGAHIACADAAVYAVAAAADASLHQAQDAPAPAWQVKKLYVHLYPENVLRMDWNLPLEHFGGKTGMAVATEALVFHASQQSKGWTMEKASVYDNSLFGLYYSAVGADVLGGDFMENIQ